MAREALAEWNQTSSDPTDAAWEEPAALGGASRTRGCDAGAGGEEGVAREARTMYVVASLLPQLGSALTTRSPSRTTKSRCRVANTDGVSTVQPRVQLATIDNIMHLEKSSLLYISLSRYFRYHFPFGRPNSAL